MNELANYDKERAAEELERLMTLCLQTSHIIRCAANVMDDKEWALDYQSIRYGPVWRLVMTPQEGSVEEAVLSFQGVIYKKDLAPFNPKTAFNKPNAARFLRQSLTLCGLKTRLFDKGVQAVLGIHALMARSMPQDELEPCSMKDAAGFTVLPIPGDIDPQGHLTRAAGNQFVYTDDNHVRYFERRKIPGSEDMRFEDCSPVMFRAGDLVEAQVTFIVVNLREGKKKTAMVLRSLSLLDGSITQVSGEMYGDDDKEPTDAQKSMVAQMLQREEPIKSEQMLTLKRRVGYSEEDTTKNQSNEGDEERVRPTLKRRVGYVHEAVADTAQRLSHMEIESTAPIDVELD